MKFNQVKRGLIFLITAIIFVYFFSLIIAFIFGLNIKTKRSGKIALIKIEGIIFSSKSFTDQLKKVEENDTIDAIVLRIDSPGGAVTPSQEIYNEIKKFKEKTGKKIVVSMANIAASGGYYIACAAHKIVANPGTLTGSIGVITRLPNFEGLFKKIGYDEQVIKSGKFKDLGSSSREMTNEEKKIFQEIADDIHQQFIEAVSESRNIEFESLKIIADGRVFTGRQAVKINLVDTIGTLEDAIDLAAELAQIPGKPEVISLKKEPSLLDTLREIVTQKLNINPFDWSPIKYQYMIY